jgi:hypothetical protein
MLVAKNERVLSNVQLGESSLFTLPRQPLFLREKKPIEQKSLLLHYDEVENNES